MSDNTTPRLGSTTPLPKIISVDDHVVEPPAPVGHLAARRSTATGDPNPSAAASARWSTSAAAPTARPSTPTGLRPTAGSTRTWSTSTSATWPPSGFDRDDMTMSPITYDEMRPGCYEPKARIADMEANWVEASLCFPSFPRFCGQTFLEAKDRELALACVLAYNDWMVEEWCGDSGGRLLPLCIIPLWDADAGRGRGAPQRGPGRAGRLLQRDPAPPGPAQHPQRALGPLLRRLRGDRAPWSACTSARRRRCRPPRPTPRWPWRPRSASATPCRRCATSCSPACSSASPP